MIDMSPIPANIIESDTDLNTLVCSQIESTSRLEKCKDCVNFYIDADQHTKCNATGCNISMMVTFQFKQCPLEKW